MIRGIDSIAKAVTPRSRRRSIPSGSVKGARKPTSTAPSRKASVSLADGGAKRIIGYLVNDWQLSGIFTGNSGNRFDLGYSFQSNGANRNLTGSPDYGARIVYVGDPGAGCTDNQYGQFNVASVTAPTTGRSTGA